MGRKRGSGQVGGERKGGGGGEERERDPAAGLSGVATSSLCVTDVSFYALIFKFVKFEICETPVSQM